MTAAILTIADAKARARHLAAGREDLTDAQVAAYLKAYTDLCNEHGITLDLIAECDEDIDKVAIVPVPLERHSTHRPGARWHENADEGVWWG